VTACALLAWVAVPSLAGADQKADSKKHYASGLKLFNKGKTKEALAEFQRAYVIYPQWKVRKNLGLCYMKLGENALALQELGAYIEEGKGDITEKEKQGVMNLIFSMLEKVGTVRFLNLPNYPKVMIDGQIAEDSALGKDLYVDPGVHMVTVLLKDDTPVYKKEMYISAGEIKEIDVEKESLLKMTPAATSAIPAYKTLKQVEKASYRKLPPGLFAFTLALALLTGAAAIGTGVWALRYNDEFYDPATGNERRAEVLDTGKQLQTATNAFIGACAGLATVSLILAFFTNFKKERPKKITAQAMTPGPLLSAGPGSFSLTWTVAF